MKTRAGGSERENRSERARREKSVASPRVEEEEDEESRLRERA